MKKQRVLVCTKEFKNMEGNYSYIFERIDIIQSRRKQY